MFSARDLFGTPVIIINYHYQLLLEHVIRFFFFGLVVVLLNEVELLDSLTEMMNHINNGRLFSQIEGNCRSKQV